MTAPPLPDIFGNYALENFTEIVSPDNVSWLPQTVGWLGLGLALLALTLRYLWHTLKHWYRNRYRREAVIRLRALATASQSGELIADINRVLKITALVAFSRERVAKLSGETWVNFLNQQCEQPPFNTEQMTLLANAVYRAEENDGQHQLLAASVLWVEQHRIPAPEVENHA